MQVERFQNLVSRLEHESAAAPGLYRAKVAALAVLGFGILLLLMGAVSISLLLVLGLVVAAAFNGSAVLFWLWGLGKLFLVLALPVLLLVRNASRALFVRLPAPQGREVQPAEAPTLFASLSEMRARMKGPRFHHVLLLDSSNAAVVQRPAFGLIGWPRNYLLLGLPLLEAMPPEEALAVVAHEYGHLAGSHGRFSAFIYRLRLTWSTVQGYVEHIQGWLGRLIAPMVHWYVPYFNAYTFVLARADEYAADAASADLVGAANVAHALKRVDLVGSRHKRFMQQTLQRIGHDPQPPTDLLQRWAAAAADAPPEADARRWLSEALDREGQVNDTHPTLRARLAALMAVAEGDDEPPPPLQGPSAAQAWFGDQVKLLRKEFETRWADQLAQPWGERHAQSQQQRLRLQELRALAERNDDQEIERLNLTLLLEPEVDLRDTLAAWNAAHADHAQGLFLEGMTRLDKGESEGLALLERTIALDPEATRPACVRALAFLAERPQQDAADTWAALYRAREQLEAVRDQQLRRIEGGDTLVDAGFNGHQLQALRLRLDTQALQGDVEEAYLARRLIPADPNAVQLLLGIKLSFDAILHRRQAEVLRRLSEIDWGVPLVVVTLEDHHLPLLTKFEQLPNAKLV